MKTNIVALLTDKCNHRYVEANSNTDGTPLLLWCDREGYRLQMGEGHLPPNPPSETEWPK